MGDLQAIQNILLVYEQASGQQINRVLFSKVVLEEMKVAFKNLLWLTEIREYEWYLGLLAVVDRNKKASLNYIKERVWNRLQGWKQKLLSQVGREVLLRVVVQAISTFAMGCFKLLVGLVHDNEMMIIKF